MRKIIYFSMYFCCMLQAKMLSGSDHSLVSQEQGHVIFITGSCSSGKSTLAKNIAQHLNAKFFAFDEYVMPILIKKMVEKSVGKFLAFFLSKLIASNFFTCVGFLSEKKKYAFQKEFYEALRGGLATEPTRKMYQDVRNVVLSGRNVVVEAPLQLGEGIDCLSSLSSLKGLDVFFVLAYCPWQSLLERIEKRNTSPNKKTHRELDWAIGNFAHCFYTSKIYEKGSLESISGRVVHNFIAEYSQPKYKKKRMYLLDETKQATLQLFKTDDMYYVYPRLTYDLIVNTKTHNPEQAAAYVLNALNSRKHRVQFKGVLHAFCHG